MRERPDREAKHRTGVVGIFTTRASVVRVVGTILAEQDDERRNGDPRSADAGDGELNDQTRGRRAVTPRTGT